MTAAALVAALGGHRAGAGWMARCPAHEDGTPSLALKIAEDGRLLVHCHAGCEQCDVITALSARGLWQDGRPQMTEPAAREEWLRPDDRARTVAALKMWAGASSARGTPVETYLMDRGITVPPPARLKFMPSAKHPSASRWPCMVALATLGTDDRPVAVHRTFLAADGRGKAPVTPVRMMLGPCRGGAVRLAPPSEPLMIGEGIETCLAAMQATGYAAWAALSTSGLKTLDLPRSVADIIIILADGDAPGEVAATVAASRWAREGRRVRIARAPVGMDFNDLLRPGSTFEGEA